MIFIYYLKGSSKEIIEEALLATIGSNRSLRECTVAFIPEQLVVIGGSEEEPAYAELSGYTYCNVYSVNPLTWPETVSQEFPETPWSALA